MADRHRLAQIGQIALLVNRASTLSIRQYERCSAASARVYTINVPLHCSTKDGHGPGRPRVGSGRAEDSRPADRNGPLAGNRSQTGRFWRFLSMVFEFRSRSI